MFKKVYVEITNECNLKCRYCIGNKRIKEFMKMDDFKIILNKLKGHTKYLYFHLMGEPLFHPLINEFIDLASKEYFVNITTNGYLIDKIRNNKNIRQVNVSLHSFNPKWGKTLDEYLNNIFDSVSELLSYGTIVKYRMWADNEWASEINKAIEDKYGIKVSEESVKLADNLYYEKEFEFVWPDLNNNVLSTVGSCMGTRSHIGILVDGTVVPCCLDANGVINLGNIYKSDLNDIISTDLFQKLKQGFCNNKKLHELCQKCNFYDERR